MRDVQDGIGPACRSQLLAPAEPPGTEQARQQVQRGGQARAGETEFRRLVEPERQAPQAISTSAWVQALDQLKRLFIRAKQNVLAVVEGFAAEFDGSCTPAQGTAGFIQGHGNPGFGERQRGSAAGPAAADDGNLLRHGNSQVLLASHSLRKGVSATRARNTGNPSRRISSSSVR